MGNALWGGIASALTGLFNLLLQAAMALITWVLSIIPGIPVWPGPDETSSISIVLADLAQGLLAWNYYVALNLFLLLVFATIIPAEVLAGIWKGIRWLLTHIPAIGGAEGSGGE